ncbi:membrane protein, putative [Rhodovulum sp. P5]|uniref:lysylphosphatidylglycerol synthase domain-containing protein n=1 Tax=Rhodovulum sp. P5 TaxID=1564506 RepID=UPI0009C32E0C|nr:lysylphosphatidylglycerol synthase domain-containing protein [Rhodovulum sp. P5]ARE38808.1 membrane protein, putative [Rhodovulum sp. P5]
MVRSAVLSRAGRLILTAAFIGISIWLLHGATRQIEFSEITQGLQEVPPGRVGLGILAMLVSFAFIGTMDVLSLKDIAPRKVPLRMSMATGAAATAVSNLLGAAYVTGVGVRYRAYAPFGVQATEVASLFAYNSLAYSLGALVLYGGVLSLHPASIEDLLPVSGLLQTAIGLALLALTGLVWALIGRRAGVPLRLFGREIPMPSFRTAVGLTGAVVADLVASGMVLHIMYPPDLSVNFVEFLAIFGIAISLGILSHSPGGLGVFEATILTATGAHGRADALAALILYRAVYTLLPFLLAVIAGAVVEAHRNRGGIAYARRLVVRALLPRVPGLTIGLTLVAGAVLVLSGIRGPHGPAMGLLRDSVPPMAVSGAHVLGLVAGALLLAAAAAQYFRVKCIGAVTVGLLCVGIGALLLQGLTVMAGALVVGVAGPLWLLRRLCRLRG